MTMKNTRRAAQVLCFGAFTLTSAQLCAIPAYAKEANAALEVVGSQVSAAPTILSLPQTANPPGIAPGAGVWVNLWNYPKNDFEGYAEKLYSSGIRNLFIQTSRSTTPAISQPDELGQIIEACHKYKIRVVAWSFAELKNIKSDADKMVYAARFRTPGGDRLDGVAPNLEQNLSKPSVEAYTRILRQELGKGYPLMAVVYSPLNKAPQVANTPWKTLAQHYDVIAPMAYWNGRYQTVDAYNYTRRTVEKVRELTERPDIEVHVIGDGMGTRAPEIKEFLRGCGEAGAQSASLYPNQRTTPEQYGAMALYDSYMPLNARERLTVVRTLLSQGIVSRPPKFDPAKPMSRGDLFVLTAHALKVPQITDGASAYDHFSKTGVIAQAASTHPEIIGQNDLASSVSLDTARNFVATARKAAKAEKASPAAKRKPFYLTMTRPSRADRLFSAPAYADGEESGKEKQGRTLNYLDAAELFSTISR